MEIDLNTLPDDVLGYIVKLRREAARTRIERNKARTELGNVMDERDQARELALDLGAQLDALRLECENHDCGREFQVASDAPIIAKGECPRSGRPLGGCGEQQGCSICDEYR